MMDYILKHPKNAALVAGGLLVLVAIIVGITTATSKKPAPNTLNDNAPTTITSRYAKVTLDHVVDTGLLVNPNDAAVVSQYEVFGVGLLPLTPTMSYRIHEDLPSKLIRDVLPTYPPTYIHIDRDTLKCADSYDCSFSFYLDSPERYYAYHHYLKPDGSEAITLQQQPFPGGSN